MTNSVNLYLLLINFLLTRLSKLIEFYLLGLSLIYLCFAVKFSQPFYALSGYFNVVVQMELDRNKRWK